MLGQIDTMSADGEHQVNVLVLGNGGREHALAWALSRSRHVAQVFVAPGNGGTARCAINTPLNPCDSDAIIGFSRDHAIELVVIGPEAPLVANVAGRLRDAGVRVFGPDAQGALLEGSKSFSKAFMVKHDLPTARYETCSSKEEALRSLEQFGVPVVVKADGLAAGKGVIVALDTEDALQAIEDCFDGAFGDAGNVVVLEEMLEGPECSMLAFVAGGHALCMPCVQDHKRAFDGDLGPNTGGMGVYSPVPCVTEADECAMRAIMQKAAQASAHDFNEAYSGVLYGGFMLTAEGPKLLEFNARFGDPETQVLMPRMVSDAWDVFSAVADGDIRELDIKFDESCAVSVVLASEGYPGSYETGKVILGIDEAEMLEGVTVFQAGTRLNADGELVTNGGRVLNVTAQASDFIHARALAYEACEKINFEGKQLRRDIALRAVEASR